MALVAQNIIDSPKALITIWVNDQVAGDGAIGKVDITARQGTITVRVMLDVGPVTQVVEGGTTFTRTFAGNSAKAGDVLSVGVT